MSFEITKEERAAWLGFYTARLHCAPPEHAAKEADEALEIWRTRRFPRSSMDQLIRACDVIGSHLPVDGIVSIPVGTARDVIDAINKIR